MKCKRGVISKNITTKSKVYTNTKYSRIKKKYEKNVYENVANKYKFEDV